MTALACAVFVVGCGDAGDDDGAQATPDAVAADELLKREAYLGVSCRESNSFACDRVGLAVWLQEPALRVDATIGGSEFALDDPEWSGPEEAGQRQMFAGFLQPAGLIDGALEVTPDDGPGRWIGREPVSATVDLVIGRVDGTTSTTSLEVDLSPGWG